MRGKQLCDEIVGLIDDVLGEPATSPHERLGVGGDRKQPLDVASPWVFAVTGQRFADGLLRLPVLDAATDGEMAQPALRREDN
jgi:hypothetical protein